MEHGRPNRCTGTSATSGGGRVRGAEGMRGAPVRGLGVGFAILLVVFAGVGVYAVNSIQATRETLEETGETGQATWPPR